MRIAIIAAALALSAAPAFAQQISQPNYRGLPYSQPTFVVPTAPPISGKIPMPADPPPRTPFTCHTIGNTTFCN